jgi:hypothetical protein
VSFSHLFSPDPPILSRSQALGEVVEFRRRALGGRSEHLHVTANRHKGASTPGHSNPKKKIEGSPEQGATSITSPKFVSVVFPIR